MLSSSMKLEREISQQTFRNEYQRATINLLFTHNWLENRLSEFFKQFDLTLQQYNIMRILKGQYPRPISTAGIRERMIDRMSDASRIVDRLYKKGLVLRKVCDRDKRLVDITLSESGLELMSTLESTTDHIDSFLQTLTLEETQQLNTLLDKVRGD
jgi:DNA-binding MarR family transcriptional regulator